MGKIQILIEMDEQGRVNVNGPLHQKALCLGIVEIARDAILKFRSEPSRPELLIAQGTLDTKRVN